MEEVRELPHGPGPGLCAWRTVPPARTTATSSPTSASTTAVRSCSTGCATLLGADVFDQVLRDWPQQHRDANVDRSDYIAWVDEQTGRDVGPFLTEWLTSPTTPT